MFHSGALRRMSRAGTLDTSTYRNPIIPGFNPDPSIIRVGTSYFLTTSSFEYTPGCPIYHSTDLIQWTLIGHALTRKSQLDIKAPEPGGGVWAPTLRYRVHEGIGWFYLTTCVWDRYRPGAVEEERAWPRGFYVRTRDIWDSAGWSEPVWFDQMGFDQDLFWDEDGTVYLSTTHQREDWDPRSGKKDQCVFVCSVDLETGISTSESVMIRESGVGVRVAEGSHILNRGKWYYLFTAEGGTESRHSEYCFRSERVMGGKWEACPHNPLVKNGTEDEVQNTGHCDFVEDAEGKWWAVCLAVRPTRTEDGWVNSVFGRETFLMPMTWSDDGWPTINNNQPISLLGTAQGLYMYNQPSKWSDPFTTSKLQLGWYRKNTPVKPESEVSLTDRPGYLRLYGGPYRLSTPSSPTAVFRKQNCRQGVWRTQVDFRPETERSEAGTVVYWNYLTWSSIGIRRSAAGGRQIALTLAEGDSQTIDLEIADVEVLLLIECQDLSYRFGFEEITSTAKGKSSEKGVQWVGESGVQALTKDPPIGNPFTGMMLGLYAFSQYGGRVPADFAFAEFM